MKNRKIFAAILAITMLASMTACSDTKTESADTTETTNIAETTTIAETTIEETTVEETTTIAEAEVEAETGTINSDVLGEYVLDKTKTYESVVGGALWNIEIETIYNIPLLVASYEDADVYVMYTDESKGWTYKNEYDETITSTQYVIISHDGAADEIPCNWYAADGMPAEFYQLDFDNDGTNELVGTYNHTSGRGISVSNLYVYDNADGHYQLFEMNNTMLDEYLNAEIDNDNHTITIAVKDTEEPFVVDTAERFPDGVEAISWGLLVEHSVDGNKVITKVTSNIGPFDYGPSVTVDVIFNNGEFRFANPAVEF